MQPLFLTDFQSPETVYQEQKVMSQIGWIALIWLLSNDNRWESARGLTGRLLSANGSDISGEEKIYMQNCHWYDNDRIIAVFNGAAVHRKSGWKIWDGKCFSSKKVMGIYGSVIEPVPNIHFARFRFRAFSNSSIAFALISMSSKLCSIW